MRSMYFKVKLRIYSYEEPVYVADGTMCIKNDEFKGYLALDYIHGSYNETTQLLQLHLYKYDWCNNDTYQILEGKVELFDLPNKFDLYDTTMGSHFTANLVIGPKLKIKEENFKEYFDGVAQIHGF